MQIQSTVLLSSSRRALLTTSLGMALAGHASAAPITWSGASGIDPTAWSDGLNWAGSAPANNITTDVAVFALADFTGKQPNAGTRSVTGIQIGTGAATGALTLVGSQLTLGASGIDMKALAAASTISTPIVLGADQTWASASANILAVSGGISGTANLTRSGSGPVHFTGTASNTFLGTFNVNSVGGTGNIAHTTTFFNKTGGAVAIPANTVVNFGTGTTGQANMVMLASNQFGSGVELKFLNAAGSWTRFDLRGTTQTFAGLSGGTTAASSGGAIQNRSRGNSTANSHGPGNLILDGSGNYVFNGIIRDTDGGTVGTDTLGLTKNGTGTQTLVGASVIHTGLTTVNSGTLILDRTSGLNTSITNNGTVEMNSLAIPNPNVVPVISHDWRVHSASPLHVFSGSGTWKKTGPGRALLFNTTVSAAGKFEIQAGTLSNDGNQCNWAASTADMDISNGATFDLYGDAIYVDELTGSGTVQNNYGNTTGFTGASIYMDKLVVGVSDSSSTFSGVIRNNSGNNIPSGATGSPAATSGGGLQLDKTGTGTLTLTGTNTYSGLTNVLAGTFVASGGSAIGDLSPVVVAAGGALLRLDAGETIGSLGGAGSVEIQAHTLTLAGTADANFTGSLTGTGGMVQTGTGVQTFAGTQTYSGATQINAGTFDLASSIPNSALTIADGAFAAGEGSALSIVLGTTVGADLFVSPSTAGALTASGPLTVNGTTLIHLAGAAPAATFKVLQFGSNANGFSAANFDLADSSSYRFGYSFAVHANDVSLTLAKKTLEWTDTGDASWENGFAGNFRDTTGLGSELFYVADDVIFGNLPGVDQTITLYGTVKPSSVTFDSTLNYTLVGTGIIGGPTGVTKNGSGTVTLAGANTYTGPTNVNAGTLVLKAPGNVDWTLPAGTKTIGSGATMIVDFTPQAPTKYRKTRMGPVVVQADGVLDLYSTTYDLAGWHLIQTWTGGATGDGTIRVTGGGAVGVWTAANNPLATFTGLLDIQNGQFACNIDSIQTLGGTLDVNLAAAGKLDIRSGSFSIDALDGEAGSSVLKSYTGDTVTLSVGNADGSGSFAGDLINTNYHLTKNGTGTQTLSGALVGDIPTSNSSFTGNITVNDGKLVGAAVRTGNNTVFGLASNTRTITVNASGTLEFQAPNTFGNHNGTNVPTLVVNGGTVTNADPSVSTAMNNPLRNVTLNNGTLTSTAGSASTLDAPREVETYGSWNINGTVTSTGTSLISTTAPSNGQVMLGSGGSDTTFAVTDGTLTVSAPLMSGDAGYQSGVIKTGTGLLSLGGANTYVGPTTVNEGTLAVGGSLANSAVTVASSATLGGSGVIAGTVTIHAGGIVAPGASTGTLGTGAAIIAGTYACEIDGATADTLAVTGSLNLTGGTIAVSVINAPTAPSYVIATFTGPLTGTPVVTGMPSGYALDTTVANQIRIIQSAGTPYNSWATSKGLTAANDDLAEDPDKDGLSNLMEYYLDGNPLAAGGSALLIESLDATHLVLAFKRRDDAEAQLGTELIQWGSNLSGWTDAILSASTSLPNADGVVVQVAENGTNPDTVTVSIPRTLAVGSKLFGRLKVTE